MAEAGDDAESGIVKNPMGLPEDEGSESLLAKEFTPEQVEALQAYLSAAKPAALQQQGDPYELVKSAFGRLSEAPTNWHQAAVFASATDDPQDEDMRRRAPVLLGISVAIVRDCPAACPHSSCPRVSLTAARRGRYSSSSSRSYP